MRRLEDRDLPADFACLLCFAEEERVVFDADESLRRVLRFESDVRRAKLTSPRGHPKRERGPYSRLQECSNRPPCFVAVPEPEPIAHNP